MLLNILPPKPQPQPFPLFCFLQAVEELRARLEVIHEIRCLEAALARAPRVRLVALASSAGYGFLNEMSFVEVRTRTCARP